METLRYVVLANGLLTVASLAYYVLLRQESLPEQARRDSSYYVFSPFYSGDF